MQLISNHFSIDPRRSCYGWEKILATIPRARISRIFQVYFLYGRYFFFEKKTEFSCQRMDYTSTTRYLRRVACRRSGSFLEAAANLDEKLICAAYAVYLVLYLAGC